MSQLPCQVVAAVPRQQADEAAAAAGVDPRRHSPFISYAMIAAAEVRRGHSCRRGGVVARVEEEGKGPGGVNGGVLRFADPSAKRRSGAGCSASHRSTDHVVVSNWAGECVPAQSVTFAGEYNSACPEQLACLIGSMGRDRNTVHFL
jgi:hypothetical protein